MPIYRGDGGSGESNTDVFVSDVISNANSASASATAAASSATAAANSATAAQTAETNAETAETAAETAQAAAETAQTAAETAQTAAETAQTNAETAETNAETAQTAAETAQTAAETAETNAATSATTATTQATAAATSATTATTQATAAATSATNAATSATNAATSETNAATSATNAATSETNAAASYDAFDDRYLGSKTSAPSTDNDGDALVAGALYYNSVAAQMYVWNGTAWDSAYVPASDYLEKTGGTMTGAIVLPADPTANLQAATKQYVDTIAAASLHYHDPVRVEKEGNLSATYDNGSSGVGATLTNNSTQEALVIDGVSLALNDRVLIYEQTDATQNGIYTVTTVGDGSTNWVLTRATDADSYGASDPDAFGEGDAFYVTEGTLGAGELYVMNTSGTITFGTTDITFAQVSSAQVYTAGTGISISGAEISSDITLQEVTTSGASTTDTITAGSFSTSGNVTATGTVTGSNINASNWDTAYGWGDHGTAGYLEKTGGTMTGTIAGFTSTGIDDNATSTAITIDASENVGIGTGSPAQRLDVYGNSGLTIMQVGDSSLSQPLVRAVANQTDGVGTIETRSSHPLTIKTANVERMRIDSSGNVGIGTASPSEKVHSSNAVLAGGAATNLSNKDGAILDYAFGFARLTAGSASSSVGITFNTAVSGTPTERMRIDSSGNVGIGTTSPSAKLHVIEATSTPAVKIKSGTSSNQNTHITMFNDNDGGTLALGVFGSSATTYGTITAADGFISANQELCLNSQNASGAIKFGVGSTVTERMRIDSSGNLLVGTTNVANSATVPGHYILPSGLHTSTRDGGAIRILNRLTSDGDLMIFRKDGTTVGAIGTSGSSTYYNTSSDYRLKENIVDAPAGNIDAVRVRSFDWKADGSHQTYGMVAQELVDVAPEAVSQGETEDDMWGVDYSKLVPMMIKEIQDLKAEVAALKGA